MHHAFSTTCRASLFSAGRVTFFVLAALLLCVNVCLPAPALAAIYDGGVSNGGIVDKDVSADDTALPDTGQTPSDTLIVLNSLESGSTTLQSCTVATGTTTEKLHTLNLFENTLLAAPGEDPSNMDPEASVLLSLFWDFSALDTSEAGLYLATAQAPLPVGYCWIDGSTQINFTKLVSVQNPNKPLLNVHYRTSAALVFPWVTPTEFGATDIEAFIAVGSDAYKNLEDEDAGWVQKDGLILYASDLLLSETYRVRIEYPEGYAEVSFLYEQDGAQIISTVEGDRDGGDGDGSGPASGEQPSPDSPLGGAAPSTGNNSSSDSNQTDTSKQDGTVQSPATTSSSDDIANTVSDTQWHENESAIQPLERRTLERYSAHETTISGTRLADLCAASETVLFDQNGVVIGLPSTFLTALNLEPSDTLSIYAMKMGSSSVTVAIAANGRPLSETPGMSVRMPFEQRDQNAVLSVLDTDNAVVSQGTLSDTSLFFAVDKPGTFRIIEGEGATDVNSDVRNDGKETIEPTGIAYGATLDSVDAGKVSAEELTSSMIFALCTIGTLAAAGGFGILAFLRKRA